MNDTSKGDSDRLIRGMFIGELRKSHSVWMNMKGSCMHPFIRDGSTLLVEPINMDKVRLGDIVLYQTGVSRIVAHQVIRKIPQGNRMTLLTKGGSCPAFNQPVHLEDLLGKVIRIERNGRPIRSDTAFTRLVNLLWTKPSPLNPHLYCLLRKVKSNVRRILGSFLSYIQSLKLYRKLIKKLMKYKICYSITVGDDAFSISYPYRYDKYSELQSSTEPFREPLNNSHESGYYLVAKRKDEVIGTVTLEKLPENNSSPYRVWWLFGLWVGWRYRGRGIGEKLTKMACELAAKNGASVVRLLVFKKSKPAINLYQKWGFRPISMPEIDAQVDKEVKKGLPRRILLERKF